MAERDPQTMTHDELVLAVLGLRREVQAHRERSDRLAAELEVCEERRRGLESLSDSVNQALNEGDGVYRP